MAELLNIPRPSLSRELVNMKEEGIIDFYKNKIKNIRFKKIRGFFTLKRIYLKLEYQLRKVIYMNYDVIIIGGAGPCGIFASMEMKNLNPDLSILILEKGNSMKKKNLS